MDIPVFSSESDSKVGIVQYSVYSQARDVFNQYDTCVVAQSDRPREIEHDQTNRDIQKLVETIRSGQQVYFIPLLTQTLDFGRFRCYVISKHGPGSHQYKFRMPTIFQMLCHQQIYGLMLYHSTFTQFRQVRHQTQIFLLFIMHPILVM